MRRAWLLVYAIILSVALGSICAINNERPAPIIRLATPSASSSPRTTLIPPVTTTPSAP